MVRFLLKLNKPGVSGRPATQMYKFNLNTARVSDKIVGLIFFVTLLLGTINIFCNFAS